MSKPTTSKASILKTLSFFLVPLILFFTLRLLSLTRIPVFVDEAIYVRWSQVMRAESTYRYLPMTDGKPPLFMWLNAISLDYFTDPLVAGRMISVLAGLVSFVAVALLGYLYTKKISVAVFASLIYAILPFATFFDRMALADSLLNAFGLLTLVFSYLYINNPKRLDLAIFTGVVIGAGLMTKPPAIFFYFFFAFTAAFFGYKKIKSHLIYLLVGFFLVFFFSQGLYNTLRLSPSFHMIGARNGDYLFTLSEVLKHPLNPLIGNLKSVLNWYWYLFTPFSFILFYSLLWAKEGRRLLLFSFVLVLLPLLAQSSMAKVYTSRYILFLSLPLIPALALSAQQLFDSWIFTNKAIVAVFVASSLGLSAWYMTSPQTAPMPYEMRRGYLEEWTAGYGQVEVADYLKEISKSGQKIVVFTEGFFGTLPDGLQIYTQGDKNIVIVGSTPVATVIPEGLVNTATTNRRFFVINSTRNQLPADQLAKLKLIAAYPKAINPAGHQEFLQFFEY